MKHDTIIHMLMGVGLFTSVTTIFLLQAQAIPIYIHKYILTAFLLPHIKRIYHFYEKRNMSESVIFHPLTATSSHPVDLLYYIMYTRMKTSETIGADI